jgi:hypothetical protein
MTGLSPVMFRGAWTLISLKTEYLQLSTSRHRRLVVRVQRQRSACHAVHAPAVLDGHKVRVVPRHERQGAVGFAL